MSAQGNTAANARPAAISLAALALITALNNVDRGMFALLLPQIGGEIPLDDVMRGFLLGPAFMLIYSIASIPIAWLADRFSRRRIILWGILFWSVVTAATGLALRAGHLAIARIALGLTESTTVAPTTALVSDLFPPRRRAAAFAVITVGTPVGVMIGFPFIGWVAAHEGWRAAFFAMGIVGATVALISSRLLQEPARGAAESSGERAHALGAPPRLLESLRLALRSSRFRVLVVAGALFSIDYAVMTVWTPTFLSRIHHMNVQDVAGSLGVYRGAFGIVAALLSGMLVSFLNRFDERWTAWIPAILCLLIVPAEVLLLFSPHRIAWQLGMGFDTFFLTAAIPCTFALLANVADVRTRSLWTAFYLLVFNLVGQGLGPLLVGALSQVLQPMLGDRSIRFAMLVAPASMLLACCAFLVLSFRLGRGGGGVASSDAQLVEIRATGLSARRYVSG